MKKFKDFVALLKKVPPILIDAYPTHGEHSKTKKVKKKLDEKAQQNSLHTWYAQHDNSHLGKDDNEVSKHLESNSKEFNEDEKEAVYRYTTWSTPHNNNLVDKAHGRKTHLGIQNREYFAKSHDHLVKHLDKVTNHKIDHKLHVYHGTSAFNPGKEAAKHPEGHIQLPAYTSTSHSKEIASSFLDYEHAKNEKIGNHVLHIHLNKGNKARYISHLSASKHEKEVLLPRNTKLKVHPEPHIIKDSDGTKIHVWKAHVI